LPGSIDAGGFAQQVPDVGSDGGVADEDRRREQMNGQDEREVDMSASLPRLSGKFSAAGSALIRGVLPQSDWDCCERFRKRRREFPDAGNGSPYRRPGAGNV